ncbi:MAG: hypothetical protein M1438_07115 [Deltaproteobacteria bacterium]|nr:hypothetical protein [Deltaproteobacteria bacterium]
MKISFMGIVLLMCLLMLGSSAYAQGAKPKGDQPDGTLILVTPEYLKQKKEEKQKALEAQKAKEDEEFIKEQRKKKAAKVERMTGHASKSWQVQNR